ncbi:MAG TPA: PA14 domain-containing protein [Puia sp.]|nr:PA14 domain-containing protein [Puia sp.]
MKISARAIVPFLTIIAFMAMPHATAQLVMSPTDSVYTYNSNAAAGSVTNPNQPAPGKIGKWIRTVRMSWNTNEYKAYIFNGSAFRIHFPKSYNPTANDGKRYPIIIFYCGDGEMASITDNEDQLAHGAQPFMSAIDAGTFDGYAVFMQTQYGWGQAQWLNYQSLIDSLVVGYKGDPYRVTQNGLSGGGQGIWNHLAFNPTYFAGSVPMSATLTNDGTLPIIDLLRFMPIWNLDGALDNDPPPYLAYMVQDSMLKYGANYTLYEFPTEGHDTWDSTWLKPGWWPYCNNVYQSNPWPLYGRTNFCPGQPINVTLGVVGGLQGYQWRKNGVNIPGATADTLLVTGPGTYDVQVKRGNYYWSDFSHTPVVITVQAAAQTPPVTVLNGASPVLPDAAGDTTVTLTEPAGDSLYAWKYLPTGAIVGTTQNITVGASAAGDYAAAVIPYQGCSALYSPAFPVVRASGPSAPPPATNLVAIGQSFTSVRLTWAANPNPPNRQTAFEVYRGSKSGSYKYLRSVRPDSLGYTDPGALPGTKYFYAIRAVDTTGAAALSNEAVVVTPGDVTPPTAPGNLTVVSSTTSSVGLSWTASTDNVGVDHYAVFVNGILTNVTTNLNFLVNALTANKLYSFTVKAVDASGNYSTPSNQVDAPAINNGLNYSYYTTATAWSVLPNFSTLTPVMSGQMPNVSIANATQATNFGYVWSGYITIPVTGTYRFSTTSDDGSALWFNQLTPGANTSAATVNNDGAHGSTAVTSAALNLTAGVYPICIEYFQAGGGSAMSVSWSSQQAFGNTTLRAIANQYFAGTFTPGGTAPARPTQITATAPAYNQVNVAWKDNSNNETGFEVYRASSANGPWQIVQTTAANTTSYSDVQGLLPNTQYYYKVQAINQYGGSGYDSASIGGISYNFYQGTFNPLYNYDSAGTPVVSSGVLNNISLSPAGSITTNFGFLYGGVIRIPKSGSWTFYTSSDDASELFINGYQWSKVVVNNNFQQGMTQRSGTITLAAGTYPFYVSYEQSGGGFGLTVSWSNSGAKIAQSTIPDSAFAYAGWTTTTLSLPATPKTPYNVTGTAASSTRINLNWTDTSSALTGYTLSRSIGDSSHFTVLANLAAGVTTYSDSALFGHQAYYYRLTATGPGGTSASTPALLVTTKDNPPVLNAVSQTFVRYNTSKSISFIASDADGDTVTIASGNLPSFANLTASGTRQALLSISPAQANQGTYPGIIITANDSHGGIVADTFTLVVNNDYPPVITPIANDTLNANGYLSFPIYAADSNSADTLSFTVTGLPGGSTVAPGPNGVDTIKLHPSYGASGNYSPIVTVNDGNGGVAADTFHIQVNYVSPTTNIYVQFSAGDVAGSPWNVMNASGTATNFVDSKGNPTTVGLNFQPGWWVTFNNGPVTGNNTGIYPDKVEQDYFFFGSYPGVFTAPNTDSVQVTGLDPAQTYSLTFYSGSIWNAQVDNGTTTFSCQGQNGSLEVQNNTQNTVTLSGLQPDASGIITFTLGLGANTTVGYLNALEISSTFNDGTAPLSPSNLTAQYASDSGGAAGVQLNWYDSAYNATGYQVFRSASASGPFTQVPSGTLPSATSAFDSTVGSFRTYFYQVRAVNANGVSNFSNVVSVTTPDKVPAVNPIASININYNQTASVNVTTTADSTNPVTLTASGLPPFASFTDNGNGTGTIGVNPTPGTTGSFQNITITSTDQADSVRSQTFGIYVSDPNVTSTYIHFSDGTQLGQFPWNNFTFWPGVGYNMQNLVNDQNVSTGMGITFTNGMAGNFAGGMQPHNGAGIYPDAVMRSGEFENTTKIDTITISGLNTSNAYNFVFFNSIDYGGKGLTNYSIDGTTVSLDPKYNLTNTARINHIMPNAAGQVNITISMANSSQSYAFINDLVVESYVDTPAKVLSPIGLMVSGMARNSVSLQWQTRSYNQTGIQVWRGTDSTGSAYNLIATLPAAATTYKDSTVTANANYFYMVRAVDGGVNSNFSNAVQATPYAYQVYMNFSVLNAPAPWNNLLYVPNQGFVWPNNFFVDEKGALTNTGLVETGLWAGEANFGMNTGNNSGVVPDAVMQDGYAVFPGQTGSVTITGLDMNLTYDITVFGSSVFFEDQNALYTANGKVCMLNALNNETGELTISGVTPDQTGAINLSVTCGTPTSQYAILNCAIIKGHNLYVAGNTPKRPAGTIEGTDAIQAVTPALTGTTDSTIALKDPGVYPNPITDYFTLCVPANGPDRIQVSIFDAKGQMAYRNEFGGLVAGDNFFRINTPSSMNVKGVYFARVTYGDKKTVKVFKIVRE